MRLAQHSARDFADKMKDLLPPGNAWRWPEGGFGDDLLLGTAQELARIDSARQAVLDNAIEMHRPAQTRWHIDDYRRVANEALNGLTETMPRKPFVVGSAAGDRVWSEAAPAQIFPIDLLKVDHLVGPLRAGSRAGDYCWGERSRYILRVRYYASVVDPRPIWEALQAFKQAHVFLWFEDITGIAGSVTYA
ncbi:MAG: hypothetical protein Q7U15_05915 [Methylotenera sp.]|nr:hypothetical protein [Methylotenera sp.]